MNVIEYGKQNSDIIMLLHGGGLSWWNYRAEAELLSDRYHVVLPILDGHEESDHDFTGIEENASRLISFIDRAYGGSVLLIGGPGRCTGHCRRKRTEKDASVRKAAAYASARKPP